MAALMRKQQASFRLVLARLPKSSRPHRFIPHSPHGCFSTGTFHRSADVVDLPRRVLDSTELKSLQTTSGNLWIRHRVAQHDVSPYELAMSLKSKLESPFTKPEVIVLHLELLYMACCRRKADWQPDMRNVANLGVGKPILEWLWEDMDQWASAIVNFDFTKHLCFFLLAEGREHHIWEMLENGEMPHTHSDRRHAWRGILFRSLLSAKILIGHHLHGSIDDALATFFVLEQKKNQPVPLTSTLQTSKYPAEVEILRAMQNDLSADTNSALWDQFCEAYSRPSLRERPSRARRIATMHLYHPTSPNPGPVLDYIQEHLTKSTDDLPGPDSEREAVQFALAIWLRLIRLLESQGRQEDIEWLSGIRQRHDLDTMMLRLPRKKDKPISMNDDPSRDQDMRERAREWVRVDPDSNDVRGNNAPRDAADVLSFPRPLAWQKVNRYKHSQERAFDPTTSLDDRIVDDSERK